VVSVWSRVVRFGGVVRCKLTVVLLALVRCNRRRRTMSKYVAGRGLAGRDFAGISQGSLGV
jgi:hypothetical protein